MTLLEIIETLEATLALNNHDQEMVVERARAADLMSDVLYSRQA